MFLVHFFGVVTFFSCHSPDLISKFKFDYIMNSQVLWGDYASVKGLAIYELFRPENARFVTVIPYEWDGHIKRMKGDLS